MNYKIVRVAYGKEIPYLEQGWEPFAVINYDTSYEYFNTDIKRMVREPRGTEFIWLRRQVEPSSSQQKKEA